MAKPTPATNATTTTLQLGYYNPFNENAGSDGFTLAADLNDYSSTFIMPGTLKLAAAEKSYVETGNIRSGGISVVRWQYKNRTLDVSISIRSVSYTAFQTVLGAIKAVVESPPFCIRLAFPGASQYSYLDVVKCTHNIPTDPVLYLNKAWPHYELHFECLPGIRGDRLALQNLVMNPGLEGPIGGGIATSGVGVFADTFANTNAYSASGGTPTVASNVMTIPVGATCVFGSSAWGAIQQWTIRFQASTSMNYDFQPHRTNANNVLRVNVTLTQLQLVHTVAGGNHVLQTNTPTLTAGTFYWMVFTQFPAVIGQNPFIQAALYNDSAGSIGTAVTSGSVGPVQTFDAVTALSGKAALVCFAGTMKVGGNFASVHVVQLFGPGGWYANLAGAAGAWEGTRTDLGMSGIATAGTQTYGGGPVTSFGSMRLDLFPAGICNSYWANYDFSSIANTNKTASPGLGGQVMYASAYVRSSGVGLNCSQYLVLSEFDLSGNFLRSTTLGSVSGAQGAWTQISGNVTLGVQTNFCAVLCQVTDNTNGSVNGTVWFDNVQMWNATTTGQTTMPYCELRFPNSPAQLVVSGLVGDMPAPAYVGMGAYVSSWGPNSSMPFVVGRQATFQSGANPTAALVGRMNYYAGGGVPTLDAGSYGGFYLAGPSNLTAQTWEGVVGGGGQQTQALLGTYHLFTRARSTQSTGNIGNVTVDAAVFDGAFEVESAKLAALAAGSTWTVIDAGQLTMPVTPFGGITGNPAGSTFSTPRAEWRDATGGGSNVWSNWFALVPIDGGLLLGKMLNPSGNGSTATNSWNWIYSDPLAVDTGALGTGYPAWRLYAGGTISQSPQTGVGGPGTATGNYININPSADAYLTLDPTPDNAGSGGVNELVAHITDGAASVLALVAELQYSPRYVWPR